MKPNNPFQAIKAVGRYLSIPFYRTRKKERPTAFCFGFSPWKTFIADWFPDMEVRQAERTISKFTFYTQWAPWILRERNPVILVWAFKNPAYLEGFSKRFGVPIHRVEDGFIRSIQLGAQKAPPASITIDRQTLYFDATKVSDLEEMLQTFDFASEPGLLERARAGIDRLLQQRISKYNTATATNISAIYGLKDRKRILVIGQVEDDASITYGCERPMNNNLLVMMARRENPDAQIIYKPHPEIVHGTRSALSDPAAVAGISQVLLEDIPIADALETIDHVYTITSLAGFEALLRGIKVTTVGCPFYSGWGLTDDRQVNKRRTRILTVEEVFAAAYLLYPRYLSPITGKLCSFEEALDELAFMRSAAAEISPASLDVPAIARQFVAAMIEDPDALSNALHAIEVNARQARERLSFEREKLSAEDA